MPPVGFEPTISAGERLKTYASDRAGTGTGGSYCTDQKLFSMQFIQVKNIKQYLKPQYRPSVLTTVLDRTTDVLSGNDYNPTKICSKCV